MPKGIIALVSLLLTIYIPAIGRKLGLGAEPDEEIDRYLTDHKIRQAVVTTPDGELVGLAGADDIHRQLSESAAR